MKTAIFNMEALVCVEIHDKKRCHYFKYQPYKKHWLWGTQLEGFWFGFNNFWTPDALQDGRFEMGLRFIVEGNTVYYRPHVTMIFAGKKSTDKVFDSYEEALNWGLEQANKGITVQFKII